MTSYRMSIFWRSPAVAPLGSLKRSTLNGATIPPPNAAVLPPDTESMDDMETWYGGGLLTSSAGPVADCTNCHSSLAGASSIPSRRAAGRKNSLIRVLKLNIAEFVASLRGGASSTLR
ncbi:hypothetical protein G6F57_021873 [Rhizopus arrhizus]|nr:hypothetical protein G6F57_021873 [Rhizopus arrhizus]